MKLAIIIAFLAFPGSIRAQYVETFDGPGSDLNYQEFHVDPGNEIDFDRRAWNAEFGLFSIGACSGTALAVKPMKTRTDKGFITYIRTALVHESLSPESGNTIAVSKPLVWKNEIACWRLYWWKSKDGLEFRLVFGDPTAPADAWKHPARIGTIHEHWILYDNSHARYAWYVDGRAAGFGNVKESWEKIGTFILGSSPSSNGRNMAYVIDKAVWLELP